MADYKSMYLLLFNTVTDVITELQHVQQQSEEMYETHKEIAIRLRDKDEICLSHEKQASNYDEKGEENE